MQKAMENVLRHNLIYGWLYRQVIATAYLSRPFFFFLFRFSRIHEYDWNRVSRFFEKQRVHNDLRLAGESKVATFNKLSLFMHLVCDAMYCKTVINNSRL